MIPPLRRVHSPALSFDLAHRGCFLSLEENRHNHFLSVLIKTNKHPWVILCFLRWRERTKPWSLFAHQHHEALLWLPAGLGMKSISTLLPLGPTKKDQRGSALCYKKIKLLSWLGSERSKRQCLWPVWGYKIWFSVPEHGAGLFALGLPQFPPQPALACSSQHLTLLCVQCFVPGDESAL